VGDVVYDIQQEGAVCHAEHKEYARKLVFGGRAMPMAVGEGAKELFLMPKKN
jgi:hypothetical protein